MSNKKDNNELTSNQQLSAAAFDPNLIGPTLPPIPPFQLPTSPTGDTGPTGITGPTGPPAPPLICDVSGSIGECSFEGSPVENGNCSFAEGCGTTANGDCSHAEGCGTEANGNCSHAEGCCSVANGDCSHSEGSQTLANAIASHSEGSGTTASGDFSHAEGEGNTASGRAAHVEGGGADPLSGNFTPNLASGASSHAEGAGTIASEFASHAEGLGTIASGLFSHAEGNNTEASGIVSHAEGIATTASEFASHAEGNLTLADGALSHTEGFRTCANGLTGVHVMGQNGGPNPAVDPPYSWYLVNGAAPCDITGVVAKILSNGSACFDSTVTASSYITSAGACDYAEMFETIDGQPIDVGYFVTFDGASDKVRKANTNDDYIVGITSSRPGILADTQDPTCSKYLLDEWNREIYEEVVVEAIKDNEGNVIMPERIETKKKLNPAWDPNISCSSRLARPEWIAVGLVGKLLVRDDGTCQVGNYCKSNDEGIATASTNGYRVMKRTGPNQIMILVR